MKKAMLTLSIIMIANMCYSQEVVAVFDNFTSKTKSKKKVLSNFIYKVQNHNTPNHAKYFENLAYEWGIKEAYKFDTFKAPFSTTFKSPKGQIIATYNKQGDLIAVEEAFKNIALPKHLIESIYIKHPGWTVTGTIYSVSYRENKFLKMRYEVQLKKGNQKKNVKIDNNLMY